MNPKNNPTDQPVTLQGDWDAQSKELKLKYTELTDDDLKLEPGKENDLITRVQTRLNIERVAAIEILRTGQIEKK